MNIRKGISEVKEEMEEDSTDERKKLMQNGKDGKEGGLEMSTLNKTHTEDEATSSV